MCASTKQCSFKEASACADELRALADASLDARVAHKISRFFKALADVNRLRIMSLLGTREMCVCEIMVALGLTQPTASHHLGILANAGLVKGEKRGKWVYYSLVNRELVGNLHRIIDEFWRKEA